MAYHATGVCQDSMITVLAGPSGVLFLAEKDIFFFPKTSYPGTRPSPYAVVNKGSVPRGKSAGRQS
jgi:hypothetical protein